MRAHDAHAMASTAYETPCPDRMFHAEFRQAHGAASFHAPRLSPKDKPPRLLRHSPSANKSAFSYSRRLLCVLKLDATCAWHVHRLDARYVHGLDTRKSNANACMAESLMFRQPMQARKRSKNIDREKILRAGSHTWSIRVPEVKEEGRRKNSSATNKPVNWAFCDVIFPVSERRATSISHTP